jgi:hypothetical protein
MYIVLLAAALAVGSGDERDGKQNAGEGTTAVMRSIENHAIQFSGSDRSPLRRRWHSQRGPELAQEGESALPPCR